VDLVLFISSNVRQTATVFTSSSLSNSNLLLDFGSLLVTGFRPVFRSLRVFFSSSLLEFSSLLFFSYLLEFSFLLFISSPFFSLLEFSSLLFFNSLLFFSYLPDFTVCSSWPLSDLKPKPRCISTNGEAERLCSEGRTGWYKPPYIYYCNLHMIYYLAFIETNRRTPQE
jgi:hypothetical protein